MKRYVLFLAALLNAVWASAQYSGSGNGTETDPYLIYNTTQLYQMNNFLGSSNAGVVFKLMKDLDLSEFINDNFPSQGWSPIGVESTPFQGKFYGNNHTLSGLWINRASTDNVGFFGYANGATIKDLTIESTYVNGSSNVGTLIGYATGTTISNCHVSGTGTETIKGTYVGGLAGYILESTKMIDCSFKGVCVKSTASESYTGGVVGFVNKATLTNCNANTNINAKANTGGICGCISGTTTLENCNYEGGITASTNVGGIVGTLNTLSSVNFANSHSKGKITNTDDYTGGIIGVSNGGCIASIESCSHFGDIIGKNYIGGIVGSIQKLKDEKFYLSGSAITNTKYKSSIPTVKGSEEPIVNNCTAIGNITGFSYIGGLIGSDETVYKYIDEKSGNERIQYINSYDCYLWYGSTYTGVHGNNIYYPLLRNIRVAYTNNYYSGIINGSDNIGGIAGYKDCGIIQNCYTNASIYGNSNVGGIIGNAEGESSANLTLKSNVAINNTISANVGNIGRIYGNKNEYLTIGALASAEGNRALTTTKVIKQGVVQEVSDDLMNGNGMGKSLLKLKANYVAMGWSFDENWDILETESFPYKKYQAAPPVIESNLVSQDTQISGQSMNGGTVYLYYKDGDAVSTECNGHNWTFSTEKLQSGASVQLYADATGMTPSYLTSTTVGYPGSGTEADPYRIYTAEDLQGASNRGYYKLMNDIDLSAWINENSPTKGWIAIGRNSGEATYINGDGHKVTGLWINTTDDYTGLFSNFSAGIIKNLTVEVASGKKVKGGDYTGILIGRNANGQILNCSVKGDIEGTIHVGGVTGYSENNTITGVSFEGKVTSNTDSAYVGGLTGLSKSNVITSANTHTTISATGTNNYIGGSIGYLDGGTITKSHAETTIKTTGTNNYVGGLVGCSKGDITLSYSAGAITANGNESYTGGLVGYAYAPITNCYSVAKTTGTYYTGGLCAYTFSRIDKCYAKGDVKGSRYGGGVVAQLDGLNSSVTNCIAANNKLDLTAQSAWGCRVIGGFMNGAAEPNNSNFALSTMQVSLNGVAQKKTDDPVEGVAKNSAVLMSADTYIALGWDYSVVWGIDEGQGYPYLLLEKEKVAVTEITLDKTSLTIEEGTSSTLLANVIPLNAQNKNLEWKSSNTNVAAVTDGVIKAVGVGVTNVVVSSTDGSNISAVCKVTVTAKGNDPTDDVEPSTDIASLPITTYIPDLVVRQGKTFSLPINLKNTEENIVGFQFDLLLPEGVSLARNARGKITAPIFNAETDRTSTEYHTISASEQEDGSVRVLCYSNANEIILGKDGTVCDFTATINEEMPASDYNIVMKNVIVTTEDLKQTKIERLVSVLSIPSFTIGDANGDEEINVTDIAATASYILGSTPAEFVEKAADVNEDNEINVTDIAGIANIILTGESNKAKASKSKAKAKNKSANPSLEVVPFTVKSGVSEMNVALDLIGEVDEEFVGFQCDIYFPEGISWKLNSRKKATAPAFNAEADRTSSEYHTASAAIQSDGSVRVLCYSNSNEVILGKDGTVLDLPIVFEKGLADGVYQANIKNVVLTRNDITQTKIDEYKFSVIVGTPELASINIFGDINAKAISAINKTLGNSTTLTSIDMSEALRISDEQAFEMNNPNTLIYIAEEDNIANTKNVVKGDICGMYEITEGFSAAIAKPFIAEKALYTRPLMSNWGTICLPFELESSNSVQYYRLVSVGSDRMSFIPVKSIEAGEPAVFKSLSEVLNVNATEVTVTDGNKEKIADAEGWTMKGTYTSFDNNPKESWNDIYYISGNKFWFADKTFPVAAFRGWFETSKGLNAKSYVYSIIDCNDATTGIDFIENENGTIDMIFDLSGKKLSTPQNGINIINGQKIRLK